MLEAVLSLGVVAFAIVAVVGLFPVAVLTGRASEHETRATFIAQSILADLQSLPGTNTALIRGASIAESPTSREDINLTTPAAIVLSYDDQGQGLPHQIATGAFEDPVLHQRAFYVARIEIIPNDPFPGLSRVQLSVEAPAAAQSSRRSRFGFVTLMDHY